MDFRSEIFKLCKEIQKNDDTKIVKETLRELFTCKEDEEIIPDYSFFHQAAKHGNNQFYGYLFANENIDMYKDVFPAIAAPPQEDMKVFERAHATIYELIKACIKEMQKANPKTANVLNPYSKYRSIAPCKEEGYLEPRSYDSAAKAFMESVLYKKVRNSTVNSLIEKLDQDNIHTMLMALETEMDRCPLDTVPDCANTVLKKIATQFEEVTELLLAQTLMIFALRRSLENACSLLFTALIGENLMVFNNDNIISIDKHYENSMNKIIQVSLVGLFLNGHSNTVGDIALIDCDPHQDYHIHEFGVVQSCTSRFDQEMGQTSQMTLRIVDDLLNPYYTLTNSIVEVDLPLLVRTDAPCSQ